MKKLFSGILMAAFAILFLMPSKLFAYSVSFDEQISVNNTPLANFKVAVQDKNVRTESAYAGMEVVTLRNDAGIFNYFPKQKMAQKIPSNLIKANLTDDLPNFNAFLEKNKAAKVGDEKVDGKDAAIYQYKDAASQADTKIWVWKEKNFPLKIEIPRPKGSTLITFTNINFKPEIKTDTFKVPEGTKITELQMAAKDAPKAAPAAAKKKK